MAFEIMATPDEIEITNDQSAYFNISTTKRGIEFSANNGDTYDDEQYAFAEFTREQVPAVMAALSAWLEQL